MSSLPTPPVLKTTIIQLNRDLDLDDNNYEILTNEYLQGGTGTITPTGTTGNPAKKKRRRSSANVDSEELAKRKNETKQLHLIIEKRRRIKINREFEALKYLIPACRNTGAGAGDEPVSGKRAASNNNGNKIDGMYKLTILKLLVEYILYLHHIIQRQQQLLEGHAEAGSFDIDFTRIPLDVNQYRNIDKEFNFKELLDPLAAAAAAPKKSKKLFEFEHDTIQEHDEDDEDAQKLLPSPEITPDMAPILLMLNKYLDRRSSDNGVFSFSQLKFSAPGPGYVSNSTLPFTNPIKLTQPAQQGAKNNFLLPDPALNPSLSATSVSLGSPSVNSEYGYPKKKMFRLKIPENNTVVMRNSVTVSAASSGTGTDDEDYDDGRKLLEHDALKTLLALRKSSIDSLLN